MLYFECCFYRAIDYAIAHKLPKVEAGAQGPHKISRGYLPSPTYSAHWIRDPNFRAAVADFVKRERRQIEHQMEALEEERSPYRGLGQQIGVARFTIKRGFVSKNSWRNLMQRQIRRRAIDMGLCHVEMFTQCEVLIEKAQRHLGMVKREDRSLNSQILRICPLRAPVF